VKEKHQIRLMIDQYNFIHQRPDLELFVYDDNQPQNQLLPSSGLLQVRPTVQTPRNHLSTIVIHKRSIINENSSIDHDNSNNFTFNITWSTSICSENQFLCGGRFETKCYSKEQRCDGSRIH
jgi:hypothetical protein